MNDIDTYKLHNVVSAFFREYRDKQLKLAGNIDVRHKHDGSDVTDLDYEIENELTNRLQQVFPGIVIMGEELGYDSILPNEFGLIDPIDGTTSFIRAIPTWTNMFVYVKEARAIYSVIYNPKEDKLFHAIDGKGAFVNDVKLNLKKITPSKIIFCKEDLIKPISGILGHLFEYRVPPSGGGHGLTLVAEGEIGVRFQLRASGVAHDYAPGGLLVHQAGGCNISIRNSEYAYDCTSFVACHPAYKELILKNIDNFRNLERY